MSDYSGSCPFESVLLSNERLPLLTPCLNHPAPRVPSAIIQHAKRSGRDGESNDTPSSHREAHDSPGEERADKMPHGVRCRARPGSHGGAIPSLRTLYLGLQIWTGCAWYTFLSQIGVIEFGEMNWLVFRTGRALGCLLAAVWVGDQKARLSGRHGAWM